MERIVEFAPAYDKRGPDSSSNYGVHGVNLRFVLKKEKGAVQFLLFTNWHLPHVQKELDSRTNLEFPHLSCHPDPADLGYHSPEPKCGEEISSTESCSYLNGKPCYYDGSGLAAERVYERLLREGSEGVWSELESYYSKIFGPVP